MNVRICFLLLLVPVLSLCRATEYYVRPTEPTHASCPGQPCLTLREYCDNSDHYFKSNTVFKFLPGAHHIDEPINMRDVQNVSLESFQDNSDQSPHIVAQFHPDIAVCEFGSDIELCAAVSFHNATNIRFSRIIVAVHAPNASGIIFVNVSNIYIQLTTVYSLFNRICPFGILIYKASNVLVDSSGVNSFITGMSLHYCTRASIINTTANDNFHNGISMLVIQNSQIISSAAFYNNGSGISIFFVTNCLIMNATSLHNGHNGIEIKIGKSIQINNSIIMYNGWSGMILQEMNYTQIVDTFALYNRKNGMDVYNINSIQIVQVLTMYNGKDGVTFSRLNTTYITSITAVNNNKYGIFMKNMNNTLIIEATAIYNSLGIILTAMNETVVANTTAANNSQHGIQMDDMNRTQIINTTITHNGWIGMMLASMNEVRIVTTSAIYNEQIGILLYNMSNIHMINTSAVHNSWGGMMITVMNDSLVVNTTVTHNGLNGMHMSDMNNTQIINTEARYNTLNGITSLKMNNTYIINTTATYNNESGINVDNMSNTHLINTVAARNGMSGIFLTRMKNTHLTNTTATHNLVNGIGLRNMTNTQIFYTKTTNNLWYGIGLFTMNHTHIANATAINNTRSGIAMKNMSNTTIININANKNVRNSTTLHILKNVNYLEILILFNTSGDLGELFGIVMSNMSNTYVTNIHSTYSHNGIAMLNMNNTVIINIVITNNPGKGIHLEKTYNTCINTISAIDNVDGISLYRAEKTTITNIIATHNEGNGLILAFSRDTNIIHAYIHQNNGSSLLSKEVSLEVGYFFLVNVQIPIWSSTTTRIHNTSFVNINPLNSEGTTNPSTLPAIIALYQSTLEISECSFKQNHISAVRAHASNVTLSGNLIFSDNTAISGAAFILVQGSIIILLENSYIHFENNYATNTGGVFYISSNDYVYLGDTFYNRTCFLHTKDRSECRFHFVNNSAGVGGDILYGGQVMFSLDEDWNCLESFKNISHMSQNGTSLISSDPSRVCLCNEAGLQDCMLVFHYMPTSFYPGQKMFIHAVVVGQNFGTVAGSVYAQYLKKFPRDNLLQLGPSENIQSVTQKSCNQLSYTLFSPNNISDLILVLTADETIVSSENIQIFPNQTKLLLQQSYHTSRIEPMLYSSNPIYINLSILPCPLGFELTTKLPFRCDCNQLLQSIPAVHCNIQQLTFVRSGLVWVGMIQDDNGTNGTVATSQYCPQNYCSGRNISVSLTRSDSQCNYNHSGILCGECQTGLSLALGSEQCLPCSNRYLALLIPFALAGPVLVGFIKLLDLTISQGTLNGLIFYANAIQANRYIFLPSRSTHPLSIFIAWLNLDLGVETCFFQGLNMYNKVWLQFAFPLYIWCIAGFIIVLSRYNTRMAKMMGNNSVPVLATLFLLSYAKLFRIIISALSYTILYTTQGHEAVWTADGNMEYLGPKHTPLFCIAVATFFCLWLPYTLVLFLGQWLYKCNLQLISRTLFKIKPFLDAHYGPLKDKHRYWFGALHLVRAAILLVSALIPADHSSIVTISILASAVVIMYIGSIVYQNTVVAMFNMGFFLNLILLTGATFFTQIIGDNSGMDAYILIGLACLQFIGLVIFKIFLIFKNIPKVKACLDDTLNDEDNWELIEQAAILRERGPDSEEESDDSERDDSRDMESHPTY